MMNCLKLRHSDSSLSVFCCLPQRCSKSLDLSLIVSRQGQILLDRIALSSNDETVCVSTSLPVDDSIDLAVASMITFFTSAAMPFHTCSLEINFDGATFTRAHFGFVELVPCDRERM